MPAVQSRRHPPGRWRHRNLFPEATRAISEVRPRAFVFENVRGLTRQSLRPYFEHVLEHLRAPGLAARSDESMRSTARGCGAKAPACRRTSATGSNGSSLTRPTTACRSSDGASSWSDSGRTLSGTGASPSRLTAGTPCSGRKRREATGTSTNSGVGTLWAPEQQDRESPEGGEAEEVAVEDRQGRRRDLPEPVVGEETSGVYNHVGHPRRPAVQRPLRQRTGLARQVHQGRGAWMPRGRAHPRS